MHRKTSIARCIYILAYVIYVIAADQSIAVQTEKIINLHDVSQTTEPTTLSSSIGFVNARSDKNGNENDGMNESTVISAEAIDDGTAEDQIKSFSQDSDFILDDLEEINYDKKEALEEDDDAKDDVATSKFEELTLDEVTSTSANRIKLADNQRDANRVAKSESKLIANAFIRNSTGSVSFQMFTELYDQYRWNINNIMDNVSNKCGLDMQIYLNALNNEVEWALKASDASGRYRGQLLFGNDLWVGSKQFCFEINEERKTIMQAPQQPVFKFFVAQILFNLSMPAEQVHTLQLAQCLPQSCTVNDIRNILNADPTTKALQSMPQTNEIRFLDLRSVPGDYDLWSDRRFQLLAAIFIIIGFIVVIATIYELSNNSTAAKSSTKHHMSNGNGIHTLTNENPNHKFVNGKHQLQSDNCNIVTDAEDVEPSKRSYKISANEEIKTEKVGTLQQLLLSFSLSSNAKTILSMGKLSEDSVTCIHGMKVFSMLWPMMVHMNVQSLGISENKYMKTITEKHFFYRIIPGGSHSVDTFFFSSGLLATLLFLREANKSLNKKRTISSDAINGLRSFVNRFLRLTPAYFVALLITEVSFKDTYSNSVLPPGLTDHLTCPTYWWRNMLYIQTWFPFSEMCMIWSWYLANDMEFFLWATIILTLSRRYFKTAATLVFAFLLGSWIISVIVSLNVNYIFRISLPLESFGFLYDQVYTRFGAYIMGMIAGYIINRFKDEPPKVSFTFNIFMWIVSMTILSLCVFGTWNDSLDRVATAFYFGLGHTAWGFALIWITLSCQWGLARPINNFLSYSGFLPLSRLTYCVYLIHPITQIATLFRMQGPLHFRHLMVFSTFLGNAVISYSCAFIVAMMFEAPILRILKVVFKK